MFITTSLSMATLSLIFISSNVSLLSYNPLFLFYILYLAHTTYNKIVIIRQTQTVTSLVCHLPQQESQGEGSMAEKEWSHISEAEEGRTLWQCW